MELILMILPDAIGWLYRPMYKSRILVVSLILLIMQKRTCVDWKIRLSRCNDPLTNGDPRRF